MNRGYLAAYSSMICWESSGEQSLKRMISVLPCAVATRRQESIVVRRYFGLAR
jgi:hypothetical protein